VSRLSLPCRWDAIYGPERITSDAADSAERKRDLGQRAADRKARALLVEKAPDDDGGGADESLRKGGAVVLIAEALRWFSLNSKRDRPKIVSSNIAEATAAAVAGPQAWSKEKKQAQLSLFARLHSSYSAGRLKPKLITSYLAHISKLGRFNKVLPQAGE
jgi:hypothetical protein